MFKPEKILVAIVAAAAILISGMMVATVADLGLASDLDLSLGSPDEVSDNFREFNQGAVERLEEGWQRFRSEGYAFQIDFPRQVNKKSILNQKALNAGFNLSPGTPVWEFKLQDDRYYQNTNLIDASLVIHVLRGEDQVQACSEFRARAKTLPDPDDPEQPPVVEINGIPFWKEVVEEGVMGETYTKISYRTAAKGACYELTQLIHARSEGLYEAGTVKSYDKEGVIQALDEVVNTFQFLDVRPSFPKIAYPQMKTLQQPVSKAGEDHVYGLDVSHWQGDINWYKVVNNGYVFHFVKATEGVGWLDVKFNENMTEGAEAGGLMGAYHFARPTYDHSAEEEAEYFLSEVGDYLESGYIRPVLDLETGYSMTKTQMTNWVMEWMETVESRSGVEPLIYTNLNFVNNKLKDEVTKYDLWIAYWSCEPEPSFDIPPTGKWADWSFWQYYGPGGCGNNYGYVPGIDANIDLNIFNGVESGLSEYHVSSPLWVSVTNYTYLAPAPHYADISADVNGDTTGSINYHFWWDCAALESDISSVEDTCGELPEPDPGSCLENENGMRCLDMDNEVQVGENTYQEIGDYTAKVIVERGDAQPAEDRYKIVTYNPIRSITPNPGSPATASIDEPFPVRVNVRMKTSVSGVVQASLVDKASGDVLGQGCKSVGHDASVNVAYDFTLPESPLGQKEYTLWARYRVGGSCPIEGSHENDVSRKYVVDWQEPPPVLEVERPAGSVISHNGTDDAGNRAPGNTIQLQYVLDNPSIYQGFQVQDITTGNAVNVSDLSVDFSGPVEVPIESQEPFTVSFQVDELAPFSFDLLVEHDASNASPYTITVSGEGSEVPDPVQSLNMDPASPGESWIDESYPLQVTLEVDTPAAGVLQASILNDSGSVVDRACRSIGSAQGAESFSLSWAESSPGTKDYTVWGRYREGGSCPITDSADSDLSAAYQIEWQEDTPVLEVYEGDGSEQATGSTDDIGQQPFYSTVELSYVLRNPSRTSTLQVSALTAENLDNLSDVSISPAGSMTLDAGEQKPVTLSFLVNNTGNFSFDLALEHDGSNASPYQFTVQGSGVMESEPIQSLTADPVSPGSALIGDSYALQVEAGLDVPAAGAVQVRLVDQSSGQTEDSACAAVEAGQTSPETFNLAWTESSPGQRTYRVTARYRAGSGCPLSGRPHDQDGQDYVVEWSEDPPLLELQRADGSALPAGDVLDLGELDFFQGVDLDLVVHNPSTTTALQISSITAENLDNLTDVDIAPSGTINVPAGGQETITVSLLVENTGDFSFDVALNHSGSNTSPYQITVQGSGALGADPIQSLGMQPASPDPLFIGESFSLNVDVSLDVPADGALQVSVLRPGGGAADEACKAVSAGVTGTKSYDLSWSESSPGDVDYSVRARYRAGSGCPLQGSPHAEDAKSYTVVWEEDTPELAVERPADNPLPSGSVEEIGEYGFYQELELVYVLRNPSTTSSMDVTGIRGENLDNLSDVDLSSSGPLTLGAGETAQVIVSFRVENTGPFSFDLVMEHDGGNPSPYTITVEGSGVMTESLIQFITPDPLPPGRALIGETFSLDVEVGLNAPDAGALQVEVLEAGGSVVDDACRVVEDGLQETKVLSLAWSKSSPAEVDYTIHARYRVQGSCPVGGDYDAQETQDFRVVWEEIEPTLEVMDDAGSSVPAGSNDALGDTPYGESRSVRYQLHNPSPTTGLTVSSITASNAENLSALSVDADGPLTLGPEETKSITIDYRAEGLGAYGFDLILTHDGSSASPYQISVRGQSVLSSNPLQSMTVSPASPGSAWVGETFTLKVDLVVEAPGDSAAVVELVDKESGEVRTGQCMDIEGSGRAAGTLELPWTEDSAGTREYTLRARYQVQGQCPLGEGQDAALTESYRVEWQEDDPVLHVKRPEGVTIFPDSVDFVGKHDWFDFVEVTYVFENPSRTSAMEVEGIRTGNFFNLKRVRVSPSGAFTLGPGEEKTVKLLFLILTVDPYAFDVTVDHNGSNAAPYTFSVHGEAQMNLDKFDLNPRFHPRVEEMVRRGFFLQIPDFILDILESYLE